MTYKAYPTAAEIYIEGDCVAKLQVEDQCCLIELPKPLITTLEDWAAFSAVMTQAIADLKLEEE